MTNQAELFITDRRDVSATFERAAADAGARTVPITIATDAPIAGPSGAREILRHTAESIDLQYASRGLPLQISHNGFELPIGRVEGVRIDGARLRGVARFSQSARAGELWQDVIDGIVSDVSVGAHIERWGDVADDGTITAERWRPVEVSLVAIGADPAAGINRQAKPTHTKGHVMNTADLAAEKGAAIDERKRAADEIGALFSGLTGDKWLTMERDALRSGVTVDVVRSQVLDALKEGAAPTVSADTPDTVIRSGSEGIDRWVSDAEAALAMKFDLVPATERSAAQKALHSNELAGMTLREMSREYLRVRGAPISGNTDRMVSDALSLPGLVRRNFSHSTSDFANLLGSSAEKSLTTGYTEAPETYAAWTRNVSMNNFREHTFTNMSLFGDLDEIKEGGEYTQGTFSDRANTATLATYGKGFTITRQAIINEDLNAFSEIPRRMGRAAARQVGDLVYAVITGDVKLTEQAGSTLFNTTDGNLAASASVIDTANMSIARKSLRTMTEASGATLNIQPSYLLVPAAIETVAQVFLRTAAAPGGSNNDVNVFQNSMELVVEPRLDADDVNAWYVMGSPGGEVDTVVVGWLDGRQEPYLESENGFNVDGMKYKVRIDCTAAALDWRGMYQNAGA
tara:strand:- start:112 stop:2004 length:1893 start_codon:yes stop_codon:yes gene_type:complete